MQVHIKLTSLHKVHLFNQIITYKNNFKAIKKVCQENVYIYLVIKTNDFLYFYCIFDVFPVPRIFFCHDKFFLLWEFSSVTRIYFCCEELHLLLQEFSLFVRILRSSCKNFLLLQEFFLVVRSYSCCESFHVLWEFSPVVSRLY